MGNPQAAAKALELLDLAPRRVRLLTAVHEAGHAVVGHTLGMAIERIVLTDDGSLDAHTTLNYCRGPGEIIPLPDLLTLRAAGFQAMYQWLDFRKLETDDRNVAINYAAAGDIAWCTETCEKILPGATMQDGILPASRALARRWSTVLRLAYAVAAAGALELPDITLLLQADQQGFAESAERYRRWRDEETADRWYRSSGTAAA